MSEQDRLDALLREALLEVNSPAVLGIDGGEPVPKSQRFTRRMARLLRSPFRAARPAWQKTLQAAACFALISGVLFVGVLTNPTARAWVERIVAEWFPEYVDFYTHGEAKSESLDWRPEWLPQGFTLVDEDDTLGPGYCTLLYRNELGVEIELDYQRLGRGPS